MNPFKYLVVTRILSATLMLPVLVIIADVISLYGTYVGVNLKGDVSFHLFFLHVFEKLSFIDIVPATIKTIFFGFAIALISCYKGYNATNGTEGVGVAANTAVVLGSLAVFILDMIAVQVTSLLI
jgi:phospholipid/cholesterol/gamma-HCH transport system permease protein